SFRCSPRPFATSPRASRPRGELPGCAPTRAGFARSPRASASRSELATRSTWVGSTLSYRSWRGGANPHLVERAQHRPELPREPPAESCPPAGTKNEHHPTRSDVVALVGPDAHQVAHRGVTGHLVERTRAQQIAFSHLPQ